MTAAIVSVWLPLVEPMRRKWPAMSDGYWPTAATDQNIRIATMISLAVELNSVCAFVHVINCRELPAPACKQDGFRT
jgi:hypothetical protein